MAVKTAVAMKDVHVRPENKKETKIYFSPPTESCPTPTSPTCTS